MKTICCYGDSNTYGYDPRSPLGERYEKCWCDLLTGYRVRNLGMNGRYTMASPDLWEPLQEADLLIVMLGTNDLLMDCPPGMVAARMEDILREVQVRRPELTILLLAPPRIRIPGAYQEDKLAEAYEKLAEKLGISYENTQTWDLSLAQDGIHLSEEGHSQLAQKLLEVLKRK